MLDDPSKLSGLPRRSSEVQAVAAAGWLDIGGSGQRVMTGVGPRGGGFGQSVERGLLWDPLLLGLCVLCVVLSIPQPSAEGLVWGLSSLLQRCTLLKMMLLSFLGWKWWATKVAPGE